MARRLTTTHHVIKRFQGTLHIHHQRVFAVANRYDSSTPGMVNRTFFFVFLAVSFVCFLLQVEGCGADSHECRGKSLEFICNTMSTITDSQLIPFYYSIAMTVRCPLRRNVHRVVTKGMVAAFPFGRPRLPILSLRACPTVVTLAPSTITSHNSVQAVYGW